MTRESVVAPGSIPNDYPKLSELRSELSDVHFESILSRSLFYVLFDILLLLGLFSAQLYLSSFSFGKYTYPVYAFLQGTIMWAVFVLGHDCGHESFSKYSLINDVVGTFLHTIILVPFYPWKLSHRHHHQFTGNLEQDEIFFPVKQKDFEQKNPFAQMLLRGGNYFLIGFGWFAYLLVGYSGRYVQSKEDPTKLVQTRSVNSHFELDHELFKQHQTGVSWSLWCLRLFISFLVFLGYVYGTANVAYYYLVPVFVFASWLVVVTFLHHHEPTLDLPWFNDENWNYVKGNLSSVDRDYGFLHWITHNIGTHQVHHLFPKVPHYNLVEATKQFKKKFPNLSRESNKPIFESFIAAYNAFSEQVVIPDDTKIHRYSPTKSL